MEKFDESGKEMKPNEALKEIKQAIAKHLHKQTGVSVEKHFQYLQYDTAIITIEQAINELETKSKRLEKVEELLDLYRLQQEFKERYNTAVRLLDQQEILDTLREIAEEIYLKEKELEKRNETK